MEGEATSAALDIEAIVQRVLAQVKVQPTIEPVSVPVPLSHPLLESIPEFDGDELGDDATVWCKLVAEITAGVNNQQRLSLATHALKGAAKTWYREWKGRPRTWEKFQEDLCAVFVSEKKLHMRLQRALAYDSNGASTYAEYARRKLTYLEQTRVAFTPEELVELINATIVDQNVRQAMINGQYKTTSTMLVGISQYVKEKRNTKENKDPKDGYKERVQGQGFSRKRCYGCDGIDHVMGECPKRRKFVSDSNTKSHAARKQSVSCTYCAKKGHEESHCWIKQRAIRNREGHRKPAVNACLSNTCNLTPVVIRDVTLRCLLDSGAECSLIREDIAQRIDCKIMPLSGAVQGLGGQRVKTIGRIVETLRFQDTAVELELLVVPNFQIAQEVIIGKNVLKRKDLKMVTDATGSRLECGANLHEPVEPSSLSQCLQLTGVEDAVRGPLKSLLGKYQEMMTTGNPVRQVTTGEMTITTQENKVISYHPYRLAYTERERVRAIVDTLLKDNIIRESRSPFASPAILVKKKDGSDRLCVDFRALNKITVRDRYPLPLIDDQLDRLGKGKYFTTLDMLSGFHQIPIAPDSICKTAFITPDGHYEYLRMPFGLTNAPAVFQRAINTALGNLRNNIALVYVDDILIPSQTIEEGLERLDQVLNALTKAGFSLNIKKCKFFQTTIEYLGREVSAAGIRPSKEKIKALLESPVPTSVKQVRQFMGLASYFRKFIPSFSVRTAPITKLTKNNATWEWGKEQEDARQYIVEKLISNPLLVIFDPEKETELHTDASAIGYGGILFQKVDGELRVVSYFSRRTSSEESRYHSYELETLAIVNALKYFRVYLLGIKFKIVTDCNAIKATSNKKDLVPRVARWWIFLQDFTFDLEYRKGKYVEHVDYLSRNPRPDYRINVIHEGPWLEVAQRNDPETKEIGERIAAKDSIISDFEFKNNILCRKIRKDNGRIIYRNFVPKGYRIGLLRMYHDENSHVGYDKTFDKIAQKYWFPRLRDFIKKYISHCIICSVNKRHTGPKQGFLHSIEKKPIPFDMVHCDCVGPFEESKEGYKHILIIVDAFTKYVQLIPLKSLSGPETLRVFRERLLLFGTPRIVVLDRGTNFTYKPLEQFLKNHSIQLHLIATGAPRANGQAERYVATVTNLLTAEISKLTEWPNKLGKIQSSLNTTIQKSTGFSPTRLLFGIERSTGPAALAEAELVVPEEKIDVHNDRLIAFERLKKNAEKQNELFNRKRKNNVVYKEGDTVFVRPSDTRRAKLEPKYTGPFTITKLLENDRYEILGSSGKPQIAPKDRLRLWKGEWSGENDIDLSDEPC